MVSWESRRDTLRRTMLGRKMPVAASRRGNAREASCRTLSLIFGAPQSVGRTVLERGITAVGWYALADEARSVDPTSLRVRSSIPQRVNRLRGTMGQEHSEHEAMFIARAAAHESSRLLDSPGSSTRNTEAPPGFLFVGGVTPPTRAAPPTPTDGNTMNASNANSDAMTVCAQIALLGTVCLFHLGPSPRELLVESGYETSRAKEKSCRPR